MTRQDVKFLHGYKADIAQAIIDGKADQDDFIIAKDTDDELLLISTNNAIKPVKARTNTAIVLTSQDIGELEKDFTIPAGTSIDDLLNILKQWFTDHGTAVAGHIASIGDSKTRLDTILANAPTEYNTFKKIADWIATQGGGIFDITDPQSGQVLLYDSNVAKWKNKNLTDNNSVIYLDETVQGLSIKGYNTANQGYMLVKDRNDGIAWVKPIDDSTLQQYVVQAAASANQAANYATMAGQAAITAETYAQIVQNKFWYGTMQEYHDLETINPSTIYIILDGTVATEE